MVYIWSLIMSLCVIINVNYGFLSTLLHFERVIFTSSTERALGPVNSTTIFYRAVLTEIVYTPTVKASREQIAFYLRYFHSICVKFCLIPIAYILHTCKLFNFHSNCTHLHENCQHVESIENLWAKMTLMQYSSSDESFTLWTIFVLKVTK